MYYIRKLLNWFFDDYHIHVWSQWYIHENVGGEKVINPIKRRKCEVCGRLEETDSIGSIKIVEEGNGGA